MNPFKLLKTDEHRVFRSLNGFIAMYVVFHSG